MRKWFGDGVDGLGTACSADGVLDIERRGGMMGLVDRGVIDMCQMCEQCEDLYDQIDLLNMDVCQLSEMNAGYMRTIDVASRLAREVLTLNPKSGELGEGKARRLIELAGEVLHHD